MNLIQMLKELGVDFFAEDKQSQNLLHVAAKGDVRRFKLMTLGLDPLCEDNAQRTAIDVAAARTNVPILGLFEKKVRVSKFIAWTLASYAF
jgi:ankyrin repeat protein